MKSYSDHLIKILAVIAVAFLGLGMVLIKIVDGEGVSYWGMVGILILILFGAFFLGKKVMKRTLRPVLEFQEVAQNLAKSYGSDDLSLSHHNELLQLGRKLNHLAAGLQDRVLALESERAKVSAILDSMVEGVIALDPQGKILLTNPSACRILELADVRVEGQSLLEVVRNKELADLVEWCRTLNSTDRYRREVDLHTPNPRVLEVNAMPLTLSRNLKGIVLVLHDITELRRLEQVRAEFVENVSHELRTPLTAINGYLETLLDESPIEPATHRRFLEVAHVHAERLGRLIDDLLNLSNIETGKVILHLSEFNLSEIVQEVAAMFEKDATKKGVTFVNRVDRPIFVYADRDRVSQILVNLVDNAVKYTSTGGQVVFGIESRDDSQIALRVQDTGQGIPAQDLPRITERFYRVDKARSRELGGTGLGLAIVKHLVQLHSGSLAIESELGKGTTVQITLPKAAVVQSV
jgi:two-component system phosphate regulon sensor histidine kinase PhoR